MNQLRFNGIAITSIAPALSRDFEVQTFSAPENDNNNSYADGGKMAKNV